MGSVPPSLKGAQGVPLTAEPSISAPIPGMPQGKPVGVPCIQLYEQLICKIFGQPERPAVCGQLQASVEMCGAVDDGGVHARAWLTRLEDLTRPVF